jgi:hypothetical protein
MKSPHDPTSAKHDAPVRYHPVEVNAPAIALFVGLVALMLVLVFPLVRFMFRHLENKAAHADLTRSEVLPAVAVSRTNFAAPRDQLRAPEDLAVFDAHEQLKLHSYGWIDRRAGVVRIPIERAMELVSARESAKGTNPVAGPSFLEIQQQRPAQTNSITGGSR